MWMTMVKLFKSPTAECYSGRIGSRFSHHYSSLLDGRDEHVLTAATECTPSTADGNARTSQTDMERWLAGQSEPLSTPRYPAVTQPRLSGLLDILRDNRRCFVRHGLPVNTPPQRTTGSVPLARYVRLRTVGASLAETCHMLHQRWNIRSPAPLSTYTMVHACTQRFCS